MKRLLITLALLTCLSTGCAKEAKVYLNDQSCLSLMNVTEQQIPVSYGYATMEEELLSEVLSPDLLPSDYCVRYSVLSEDINEWGIFHASDQAEQKRIEKALQRYLRELTEEKRAFIAGYAPRELIKLENAGIRSFGLYTAYAILDEEGQNAVFDALEQTLCP